MSVQRLRNLLEAEEKGYLAEIELQEENIEGRQNNMRVRAKQLREKREEARRKLVAEKREQQFREDGSLKDSAVVHKNG
ncbi:hypothetical protein JD844_008294 [Phrynosoma platyrhinos]|uniref:Uncharacterized protein n=1 Tax=Phrynosoma platyrhinos TaxID=52577 RepID=A0ABQ7TEH5_PHRPL|nr:hypothetical protein JD844_008294 [Phrynosoma platyrhinos]